MSGYTKQENIKKSIFAVIGIPLIALGCLYPALPARADDHGHGGTKPKIVFIVGPVTKTHDPAGSGGGKGKDPSGKTPHQ